MSNAQHPLITEWYEAERQKPIRGRAEAKVVTGFPLWGDAYVRRFKDYMLPSMLAPGNRDLFERGEVVLYVDRAALRDLEIWGVPATLRLIPDEVMAVVRAEPGYKYTLLAAVHNLLIQQAAAKGAGFSMTCADHVYSDRFFERLLHRGKTHDAIAHLALITSEAGIGPVLANRPRLSARKLGSAGWHFASGLMRSWLMNDVETLDTLPGSHILVWRGLDAIHIHCPHLTPIWLSAERCKAMPTDLGNTLDAMGHLYPDFYVPTVADDMTVLTLDDTRNHPAARVPFETFREGFRPFASCMAQFRARCVIPTLPAPDGLPADVIEQRFAQVVENLG